MAAAGKGSRCTGPVLVALVVGLLAGGALFRYLRALQERSLFEERYYPVYEHQRAAEGPTNWLPSNFPSPANFLLLRVDKDNNQAWAMFHLDPTELVALRESTCTTSTAVMFSAASRHRTAFQWWPSRWPEDLQYLTCEGAQPSYYAIDPATGHAWLYHGKAATAP